MLVQIYEVTSAEEASALTKLGVDHIGVLVGKGEFPREQSIEAAKRIFVGIPPSSKGSALCLPADLSVIGLGIPVIIAGGLGPDNVVDAIRAVHPAGVDSKTKTDKDDGSRIKDLQKVKAICVFGEILVIRNS